MKKILIWSSCLIGVHFGAQCDCVGLSVRHSSMSTRQSVCPDKQWKQVRVSAFATLARKTLPTGPFTILEPLEEEMGENLCTSEISFNGF